MLYTASPWLTYVISKYDLWPLICDLWSQSTILSIPVHTPLPLSSTHLFSVSEFIFLFVWFIFFLDSTYKWDHTVLVFLCLTYFTYHNALHVVHSQIWEILLLEPFSGKKKKMCQCTTIWRLWLALLFPTWTSADKNTKPPKECAYI